MLSQVCEKLSLILCCHNVVENTFVKKLKCCTHSYDNRSFHKFMTIQNRPGHCCVPPFKGTAQSIQNRVYVCFIIILWTHFVKQLCCHNLVKTTLCCHKFVKIKLWTKLCVILCCHKFVKHSVWFHVVIVLWQKKALWTNWSVVHKDMTSVLFTTLWQCRIALDTVASLPFRGQHSPFKIECPCL